MAGRVFQVVECLRGGDGVSQIARQFAPILAALGCEPTILCHSADEVSRGEGRSLWSVAWTADDAAILHVHGFSELESFFASCPGRKAIYFHNITPASFFDPGTSLWQYTRAGWDQLTRIARLADLWFAPSVFNLTALKDVSSRQRPSYVLPPVLDPAMERVKPIDHRREEALGARRETNFLFVGRLTPNKRQDLVMEVFDYYHTRIDRRSRLHLVGDPSIDRGYVRALEARRAELPSGGAIELTGKVDAAALHAHFRAAHLFLCFSEHEGVCLPALDAMAYGVPVLARATAALPEALGKGAILVNRYDAPHIAELCQLILNDSTFRDRLVEAGRQRLDRYTRSAVEPLWETALAELRGSLDQSNREGRAV